MSARTRAAEAIRFGILTGKYPPGSRLGEDIIAEEIGTSRTPVREALHSLSVEGLVTLVPHRGAVVTDWGPEEYDDLLRIRAMVEGAAARFAATRADAADIAELTRIVDEMSRPDCTREDTIRLGGEFNTALQTAARSPRLASIAEHLGKATWIVHLFDRYSDDDIHYSVLQHREIVEAVRARDPEWAEAARSSNILRSRRFYPGSPVSEADDTRG
ncbi:GntR family transcriptional regulator [Amycolatopsis sp. GM8]|uniref:GntR family transcriptional regulator n=1 Tax=Amycolatopsis sp. GM8 TaxID=2896530 RepID=UPI001F3455D9|nr:GntR family transcriptional regulator [Amycolatopsis sp. GM8]